MTKPTVAFRSCFEKASKNKKQTYLKISAVENTRGEAKFLCFVAWDLTSPVARCNAIHVLINSQGSLL